MRRRVDLLVWPIAGLTWLYLVLHSAHKVGLDFPVVYRGPYDLFHHISPYPARLLSSKSMPFEPGSIVHPPSSPIVLAPFGALPQHIAGPIFVVLSAMCFVGGILALLGRSRCYRALVMLAAGLAVPVHDEMSTGNVDLLSAGLVALSLATAGKRRLLSGVLMGLAIALKPTMWPAVLLLSLDRFLFAVCSVLLLNVLGLLLLVKPSRFFHVVLPWLSHGQPHVNIARVSVTDVLRALGIANRPAATLTGAVLLILLALIVWRVPSKDRLQYAPLVVLVTLLLSSYSFSVYAVYLVAVIPLLRLRRRDLPAAGIAFYAIGASDVWSSRSLPHFANVILNYRIFGGLVLLFILSWRGLTEVAAAPVPDYAPSFVESRAGPVST